MDFEKLKEFLPKDPIKWSIEDIKIWLDFIGLSQYYQYFQQHSVDGSCLTSLTESDLRDDLQVQTAIQRKKIKNWLNVGLKEYSSYLKKNKIIQEDQIIMSEYTKLQKFEEKDDKKFFDNFNISYTNNELEFQKQQKMIRVPNCDINALESSEEEENNQQEQQNPVIQSNNDINNNINNIINNLQEHNYELIIEPVEGVQANYFCIKEQGGKIGRHSSNQILILEESISRFHAEIEFKNNQFYLKDIGSTTGTFIKIKDKIQLTLDTVIEMGSNQYEVTKIKQDPPYVQLTVLEGVNQSNPPYDVFLQLFIIYFFNIKLIFTQEMIDKNEYFSIGRKNSNKIILPDDQHLSNLHAKIYFIDMKIILEDHGSTNGSWLRLSKEGIQSESYSLDNNTTFKIGTTSTYNCKIKCLEKENFQQQNNGIPNMVQWCVICCENERNVVFIPCRHNCTCIQCSKNIQECPICRTQIRDTVQIYKA
ncbi:hypothetical protein IMG5_041730 [Ichthyophthirius multifiliis]|uniref:Uncharacterized protein n=1 Tax=Ichthyophthirius multifiliis TaxID=5932 RepID=G0QM20_ICHMU|nr:hypothetical protein IMG5_041730 [Ichthyophthirius multifiliis]EGR33735.1 hypothetical protein IMG5_041730 [Ichthyophthirius multifiliis]|eukprot:XP_004037721.1 hypothetical protein IMG5_041730 [Ichthyophthirius multifiliis]